MAYKCRLEFSLLLVFFFGLNHIKTISNSTHLNQITLRMTSKKISSRTFFFCGQFYCLYLNDVMCGGACYAMWNRWIVLFLISFSLSICQDLVSMFFSVVSIGLIPWWCSPWAWISFKTYSLHSENVFQIWKFDTTFFFVYRRKKMNVSHFF